MTKVLCATISIVLSTFALSFSLRAMDTVSEHESLLTDHSMYEIRLQKRIRDAKNGDIDARNAILHMHYNVGIPSYYRQANLLKLVSIGTDGYKFEEMSPEEILMILRFEKNSIVLGNLLTFLIRMGEQEQVAVYQNLLALYYNTVNSVDHDRDKALKYLQLAADRGFALAQLNYYSLTIHSAEGQALTNYEAFKYLETAVSLKEPMAMVFLAKILLTPKKEKSLIRQGQELSKHEGEIYRAYQTYAMTRSSDIYDPLDLLRTVAQLGFTIGHYSLFKLMIKDNLESHKALDLLQEAAEDGCIMAQSELGQVLLGRAPFDHAAINKTLAIKYIVHAAHQGDPESQITLGRLYESGFVLEKDTTKALRWFVKASERSFEGLYHAMRIYDNTPDRRSLASEIQLETELVLDFANYDDINDLGGLYRLKKAALKAATIFSDGIVREKDPFFAQHFYLKANEITEKITVLRKHPAKVIPFVLMNTSLQAKEILELDAMLLCFIQALNLLYDNMAFLELIEGYLSSDEIEFYDDKLPNHSLLLAAVQPLKIKGTYTWQEIEDMISILELFKPSVPNNAMFAALLVELKHLLTVL